MYQIIKRTGKTFAQGQKIVHTAASFEAAWDWATDEICNDIWNEPRKGADSYWFSDELDGPYKVHIQKI